MHDCVGAFILQRDAVLLGKRSADRSWFPGVWDIFGGHIESGEGPLEALDRELFEELGIRPTHTRYLQSVSIASSPLNAAAGTCHFYVVTAWDGTPENRAPMEHSEVRWFKRDEVVQLELASSEYTSIIGSLCEEVGRV
jgi:8-oxo-dGTP pyrophosphatase MutT (NUDIX family)